MIHLSRTVARLAAAGAVAFTAVVAVSISTDVGAGGGVAGVTGAAPVDGSTTDQVIVTFDRPGRRLGQADLDAAGNGAAVLRTFGDRAQVVKLSSRRGGADLEAVMERLARRPNVVSVEADQIMQLATDDTRYGEQWDLGDVAAPIGIDVEGAWSVTTGSNTIKVAVLDTGYLDHADLDGRFVGGYDFVSDSQIGNDGDGRDADAHDVGDWITANESRRGFFRGCPVGDSSWHGSHVSGTIGAATDNGQGIAGINQVSQIVPIRVLGKCGGYTSDIVDGMRWAAGIDVAGVPRNDHPARVLSMSLGGSGACSSTYQDAVNDILARGAVIVVAAGNSNGDAAAHSPSSCNGVVTVAATGKAGDRSYYSNYGSTVEIAAPGGDRLADDGDTILSTINAGATTPIAGPGGDVYEKYQGTSMATPHVSGVVSLMLSARSGLSPSQVTQILQATATPFPAGSTCIGICGPGILNAAAAVSSAQSTATTTSSTTTTTLSPNAPVAFAKQSPTNGETGVSTRPTFQWAPSANATSYEVCIDTVVGGACTGQIFTTTNTALTIRGFSRSTTYEWQVTAINAAGRTDADAATPFSFTTR